MIILMSLKSIIKTVLLILITLHTTVHYFTLCFFYFLALICYLTCWFGRTTYAILYTKEKALKTYQPTS